MSMAVTRGAGLHEAVKIEIRKTDKSNSAPHVFRSTIRVLAFIYDSHRLKIPAMYVILFLSSNSIQETYS